jgi:hypothetical protein
VFLEFIAQGVIELFIQVVRKLGEHCLAPGRPGRLGGDNSGRDSFDLPPGARLPQLHQFFSHEQPGPMETNPNGS